METYVPHLVLVFKTIFVMFSYKERRGRQCTLYNTILRWLFKLFSLCSDGGEGGDVHVPHRVVVGRTPGNTPVLQTNLSKYISLL
jgi:hypothetical protein